MEAPSPYSTPNRSVSPSKGVSMTALESSTPSIFRSLAEVFGNAVPQAHIGLGIDGWPNILDDADSEFENGKALRTTGFILQYLRQKSPVILVPATKILADGSRDGKLSTHFPNSAGHTTESQLKHA